MQSDKVTLLSHAMKAYAMRMEALSSNIANLDTPGYRRMVVKFEESLQGARRSMVGGEKPHEVDPTVFVQDVPPVLEDEMMEVADTQMRTQVAARALREHFNLVRSAISGRTG